jgi:hypothetical protein
MFCEFLAKMGHIFGRSLIKFMAILGWILGEFFYSPVKFARIWPKYARNRQKSLRIIWPSSLTSFMSMNNGDVILTNSTSCATHHDVADVAWLMQHKHRQIVGMFWRHRHSCIDEASWQPLDWRTGALLMPKSCVDRWLPIKK